MTWLIVLQSDRLPSRLRHIRDPEYPGPLRESRRLAACIRRNR